MWRRGVSRWGCAGRVRGRAPGRASRGGLPDRTEQGHNPKASGQDRPQAPHTRPGECRSANAITSPAAAASTTKALAVILMRLDPSAMKQAAPAITKNPSTIQVRAALPIMAAPPTPAMIPKRLPPFEIRMLMVES
jgi:hypothetical protein